MSLDLLNPVVGTDERARSQGGLGLGLSIVKGMFELPGGQVTVWSEGSGKGSTSTIVLPLRQRTADAAKASAEDLQ